MIKSLSVLSLLIILLASCTEDQGLCECVDAGDKVNHLSATFLDGSYSEAKKDSLDQAKTLRDSLCEPYQNMKPEELHKAAEKCSSLKMNPPQ